MGSSWSGKRPYVHFFCKKLKSASGCIFKPANERERKRAERKSVEARLYSKLLGVSFYQRESKKMHFYDDGSAACGWFPPCLLFLCLLPSLVQLLLPGGSTVVLLLSNPNFIEFSYAFQAEKNLEIECYFAAFESSFWRSDQCEREHCTYSNRQTQNQNCVMTYFPLLLRLCCRCCHRGAVGNGTVEHSSSASPVPPRGDRLLKCRVFERPCPTKRESRRRAVDARRAPPLWKTSILMPWLRSILHGKLLSHPCNCGCF